MTYEIAKQLKDGGYKRPHEMQFNLEDWQSYPALSELIAACPKPFQLLIMPNGFATAMSLEGDGLMCHYPTPEEAIAKLWLALKNNDDRA